MKTGDQHRFTTRHEGAVFFPIQFIFFSKHTSNLSGFLPFISADYTIHARTFGMAINRLGARGGSGLHE